MRHFPWRESVWALGVCGLLVATYVVAYALSIDKASSGKILDRWLEEGSGETIFYSIRTNPEYAVGGDFAEWLFQPIHEIDAGLRPDVWFQTGPIIIGLSGTPGPPPRRKPRSPSK